MKLLLIPLLAAAGLSFLGLGADGEAAPAEPACAADEVCPPSGCDAKVERLPDGTCRVECTGPDGETCWAILACDEDGGCEVVSSGGDCPKSAGEAACETKPASCAERPACSR